MDDKVESLFKDIRDLYNSSDIPTKLEIINGLVEILNESMLGRKVSFIEE